MRIADGTGWGRHAYKLLQGDINLYHVPHNCGGTKVHKQMLKNWLSPRPNLVFINAGLHDLAFSWDTMKGAALWVSLDEYAANLQWEVELMRSEKVATILWGLCTPVQEDWHRFVPGTSKKRRIGRRNSDIEAYNSVAEAVMCQLEVPVVDLYTPVVDGGVENLVLPDGVHLNTLGAALVGELVATSTTEYLEGLA
jgi:lysophospholipase L1-like esterase